MSEKRLTEDCRHDDGGTCFSCTTRRLADTARILAKTVQERACELRNDSVGVEIVHLALQVELLGRSVEVLASAVARRFEEFIAVEVWP